MKYLINKTQEFSIYLGWAVATGAMIGSLVLSEVIRFIPCDLCWWQRVFMYPMAFILTVGILKKDKKVAYYVLPLSIIGLVIAFYHSLLQWHVIRPENLSCSVTSAVSCADAQINWLGFITIPFMSLCCFLVVTILMFLSLRKVKTTSKKVPDSSED